MQYLKIKNKGELDIRLICLMGASTKTDDPTKLGQFGTGLKYAISYLLRNKIDFRLFCGKKEVLFTIVPTTIAGKDFEEIYCDGQTMNITTQYGYQWQAWEAMREIWCNATDEGADRKSIMSDRSHTHGAAGHTTFYIGITEAIQGVLDKWNEYFLKAKPLFSNEQYAIYPNTGKLKLYKNSVLIYESSYAESLFAYDIKEANLNELRQFMGSYEYSVGCALLSSNREVIAKVMEAIKSSAKVIEATLNWDYVPGKTETVKEIFSGYLFLHPQSNSKAASASSVIVNQSLYNLLKKYNLPCERVEISRGGYYGGGGIGYGDKADMKYKEILNRDLQKKIEAIAEKYHSGMTFKIVSPLGDSFDLLVEGGYSKTVLFSTSLLNLSAADLESTVLIGIMHTQEENIFKAFKRLVKSVMGNRNFKKIIFGRNIGTGEPAKYLPPVNETALADISLDEDLPF